MSDYTLRNIIAHKYRMSQEILKVVMKGLILRQLPFNTIFGICSSW